MGDMEQDEPGRVRLRAYVVEEAAGTLTIPVRREEIRVEREPAAGAEDDEQR
ncbi:DUF2382 domain-containing protein [Solirubrobacter sp. CPCC 204708]|uniref:DUF2382 domain-containing protein n=1 Tax=Solirubrobacter deserti TaxID=2282478 RepID=A0ABT4RSY6_9ACTN|nr:DUF2382 domain-containing protein [Solirubrobacter deserti]MBE2320346.1 DUF2382 domain-containing protein [Solirubrobacter deserti]MDA0141698.1 DUF2382 domain-containing protein [Solirubrobacter deserti]